MHVCRYMIYNIYNSKEAKPNPEEGGVPVTNVLDYNIVVGDFKLQSCYYIHFWTGMNPLIPPAVGEIIPLLLFYKDGFGIK